MQNIILIFMAVSLFPLQFLSSSVSYHSSPFVFSLSPYPKLLCQNGFATVRVKVLVSCSQETIQMNTTQQIDLVTKKKRKPRPSFLEQIHDKWSVKTVSLRERFPWQEEQADEQMAGEDDEEEKCQQSPEAIVSQTESDTISSLSDPFSVDYENRIILAPWVHGGKPRKTLQFDSKPRYSLKIHEKELRIEDFPQDIRGDILSSDVEEEFKILDGEVNGDGKSEENVVKVEATGQYERGVGFDDISLPLSEKVETLSVETDKVVTFGTNSLNIDQQFGISCDCSAKSDSMRKPWERESFKESVKGVRTRKSNTKLAESLIPEPVLKRLRNVSLRMLERIRVGEGGVTQALVDSIHEKWKTDEVVKLKFEGTPVINMKRTHEILESRTGGLVIWRSGSSMVLYRGMTYKFPCVKSLANKQEFTIEISKSSNDVTSDVSQRIGSGESFGTMISSPSYSVTYLKRLSKKELMDFSELNQQLDELGPRFIDWSGRAPLPVDADLLPPVIPGYKPPFRLLPYGIKPGLRNKETTFLRRTARTMPPHFALGRNRELHGLAMAMVKLWERSAIAKIAIKRGVLNTCNERMAEELKFLTGGTLLSRNKEYIVFYRGNDFLPPAVTKTLVEAKKRTTLQQDEEEQARNKASTLIDSNTKAAEGQLVAGTLSETLAATSRWANQPSGDDIEKMKKDLALERHASLVQYLEKKLALAKGKIKRAEKALKKLQESLEPADLPTDLETITDEERSLLRKIGLSMKPYLLLGRRGIFDGTIENMHLHWKYRELVKIIVKGKSFSLVKHVAIYLESESGGVLISIDRTMKGYAIIVYRGKNYQRPRQVRPKNLLTRRQALARSIELQRREALKHHVMELQEKIVKLKSELENMKTTKEIDEETLNSRLNNSSSDDDTIYEDEECEYDETALEIKTNESRNEDVDD